MKRKLTSQERELTVKGILNLNKEVERSTNTLAYNLALIDHQKIQRDFDDRWRDYLRGRKDEEDAKIIKMIENEIKQNENTLKINQKHLDEGVEKK